MGLAAIDLFLPQVLSINHCARRLGGTKSSRHFRVECEEIANGQHLSKVIAD